MDNSIAVFMKFLTKYVPNSRKELEESDTIEVLVENNFDFLDERLMRLLIQEALKERDSRVLEGSSDSELLGSWGVVIDAVYTLFLLSIFSLSFI